jgi:uncharacterized protein YndB with AHSA1/START domain
MEFEAEFATVAPPTSVWAALVDVESWPKWISSYRSIQRVDTDPVPGPLRVGSRAEVRQPGLATATYTVTSLDPGREFTWETTAAGVRTVARHVVEPADGGSRLRLELTQTGALAGLVGMLLGGKIRRYLDLEGHGHCAAAESVSGA